MRLWRINWKKSFQRCFSTGTKASIGAGALQPFGESRNMCASAQAAQGTGLIVARNGEGLLHCQTPRQELTNVLTRMMICTTSNIPTYMRCACSLAVLMPSRGKKGTRSNLTPWRAYRTDAGSKDDSDGAYGTTSVSPYDRGNVGQQAAGLLHPVREHL